MNSFLYGAGVTLLYIVIAAAIMLIARKLLTIPDELFRKILHFILLGAYIPLVISFEVWWMAAIFAVSLIIILFPAISLAEKIPLFSSFVNERKKGEFKSSMALALGMMAFSVSVCWGIMGDRYLVLASIYAWGIGDAFAALVGKRFGKHKITWKIADNKKSVEGSLAMFLCSLLSVFTVLYLRGGIALPFCILIALVTAAVCALVELCTRNGLDTVICPLSAMAVIIPSVMLFGG